MYSSLLFVPNSNGNRKRQALIDSACRAHNMRVIHRKRRIMKKRRNTGDSTDGFRGAREAPEEHSITTGYGRPTCNPVTLVEEPVSLSIYTVSFGSILPYGDKLTSVFSPNLSKAIQFVRFHLIKSWSPTFMLRLQDNIGGVNDLERSLQSRATQWMWLLWTSDIHLFWSVVASILPLLIRELSIEQKTDMKIMALDFKRRSYSGLRDSLDNLPQTSDTRLLITIYHIKSLFREACASGDADSATCHVEALAQLASELDGSRADIERRRIVLWGDALPALIQLRRPVVDLSIKMADVAQQIWAEAGLTLLTATLNTSSPKPPDSILIEDLQGAFVFLRQALSVIDHRSRTPPDRYNASSELIFQWVTTKAEHHMCRLLNLYHDLKEYNEVTEGKYTLSIGERYMHMSAALALLHIYQKAFFDIYQANGTDVNETALAILPGLVQTMRSAKKHCSRSEWCFYRTTAFWILFVGTWAEQRLKKSDKYLYHTAVRTTIFDVDLPRLVADLGLTSWSKAKPLLESFAWTDYLDEEVGIWYELSVCSK